MLNLEQFKTEFPDIYKSVFNEGYQAGMTAGKALQSQTTVVHNAPENLTPEERYGKMWNEDVDLRMEFQGEKEAWIAYAKADARGSVRICGRRPE